MAQMKWNFWGPQNPFRAPLEIPLWQLFYAQCVPRLHGRKNTNRRWSGMPTIGNKNGKTRAIFLALRKESIVFQSLGPEYYCHPMIPQI